VGQHGPLRCSRGTRRVDDGGQVVGLNGSCTGIEFGIEVRWSLQHQSLHVQRVGGLDCIHHYDVLNPSLILNRQHLFQLTLGGHNHYARSGIVQNVCSLLRRLGGINGNSDGAQGKGREVGDRPFRAVLGENGDAIAFANSPRLEPAGYTDNVAVEFARRDRHPAQNLFLQHDAIASALADRQQNVIKSLKAHPILWGSGKPLYKVFGNQAVTCVDHAQRRVYA
jgi:hypothetical protein